MMYKSTDHGSDVNILFHSASLRSSIHSLRIRMTSYPCNKYEQITPSYLLSVKYISGNTCVCLADLFWSLIDKMQYLEIIIYDKMVSLLGRDDGHILKFCLTTCYIKLRVKIHHYIFTEITQTS